MRSWVHHGVGHSRLARLAVLAGLTSLLVACSSEHELAPVNKISSQYAARGAGGSFALPIYHEWAEDLNTLYAAPLYVFNGVGSAEGIAQLIAGEVDFGASDIHLDDSQKAAFERPIRSIPMTAGLITLARHTLAVDDYLATTAAT